jgi:uncharacterized protein
MAGRFVLKTDSSGEYYFTLVAANGEVIATSETFLTRSDAERAIEAVMRSVPSAEVDDRTGS